jgi:hypothetical protein
VPSAAGGEPIDRAPEHSRVTLCGRDLREYRPQELVAAADGRSVPLVTHRPEDLELVDEVVEVHRCSS